ncbi:MAG TPA: DivIVA domain-containing protein [Ornithinibacter sp.]|nr:DivIVA domain-containing protein [Ornithinibacter sp.]
MARLLRSEDVVGATFTQTQFREGYDEREVDDLLDEAAAALRHHEGGLPAGSAPLTSGRVAAVRFTPTKLRRGYDQGEIDAFLDDLRHTLRHHESGGRTPAPSTPASLPAPTPRSAPPAHTLRSREDLPPGVRGHESLGTRVLRVLRGDRG